MSDDTAHQPDPEAPTELVNDGWIGRVIDDRYKVVGKLGAGGMGAVYVARHEKLQKNVAVKVIHSEFAGDDEVAARFAREAMASAQIEHPHVAGAIDYGVLPEGGAYLVMQLARGESLRSLLTKEERLSWISVAEIGAQVADALASAHSLGIVHRDLKPENIIVELKDDHSMHVKVLDFGIARILGRSTAAAPNTAVVGKSLTQHGTVLGTLGYMAPEQALGQPVDERVDLYALGAILWEAVTGRPLFEELDLTAIVTRQLTQPPPPMLGESEPHEVPRAFEQLVSSLLARDANGRPRSAAQVRDTLRDMPRATPTLPKLPPSITEAIRRWTAPPRLFVALGAALVLWVSILAMIGLTFLDDDAEPAEMTARTTAPKEPAGPQTNLLERILGPHLGGDSLSSEVQARIDVLSNRDRRIETREAARWITERATEEDVPEFALALAELELARGCRSREEIVRRLQDIGDVRALAAIERWSRKPRRGCGFLRLRDCHACIRDDLREAAAHLRAQQEDG